MDNVTRQTAIKLLVAKVKPFEVAQRTGLSFDQVARLIDEALSLAGRDAEPSQAAGEYLEPLRFAASGTIAVELIDEQFPVIHAIPPKQ